MRSPACISPSIFLACGAVIAGSLAGCGGGGAGGQGAPAAAPIEVVLAPVEPSAAPAPQMVEVAPTDAPADEQPAEAVAKASSDERAKLLEADLSRLDMVMLSALGGTGNSVNQGVLTAGGPVAQLGGPGSGGLSLGGGGIGGGGLAGTAMGGIIGGVPGGTLKGPVGVVSTSSVSGVDDVPQARAVIAGMGAGFRRCYNAGLTHDPAMKGGVTLSAVIGPSGQVLSSRPSASTGLSSAVITCLVVRLRSASFSPPTKGTPTLTLKLTATSK